MPFRAYLPFCSLEVLLFINQSIICLSVINCTSLMVDQGGPLRMGSCGNHYGARCEFSCANGYRLNGSSDVTCVAKGDKPPGVWDNPVPSCKGR